MSELEPLAADFWAWRHRQAPTTRDDITRVVRPVGWVPDWSPRAVASYRASASEFQSRLDGVDTSGLSPNERTDLALLQSAIRRIGWELDVVGRYRHDPRFYVEQALGPFYELLLPPPPFEAARVEEIVRRLGFVEPSLDAGRENLAESAFAELSQSAIDELAGIELVLPKVADSLAAALPGGAAERVAAALAGTVPPLVAFRDWLTRRHASMQPFHPIGREAFEGFLTGIAYIPFAPDEMVLLARREMAAARVWEAVAERRGHHSGETSILPSSAGAQCERQAELEHQVRDFYESLDLLSQPEWLRRYHNLPAPEYISQLSFLGVSDDLTDAGRLDVDGISYVPEPTASLPYFYRANAIDPRLGIVHEGAHYQQLALSWAHPDPIRREYYDSAANEGLAFYNEELMLQAGLFEHSAQATRVMHNFMRLRALRVEVDVRLALGELSIPAAADLLERRVPMDRATALHEAAFFASTPGQGLTYQVGKWQILDLLAAVLEARPETTLRQLHDYLWLNGNVPPSLLQAELLAEVGHSSL